MEVSTEGAASKQRWGRKIHPRCPLGCKVLERRGWEATIRPQVGAEESGREKKKTGEGGGAGENLLLEYLVGGSLYLLRS